MAIRLRGATVAALIVGGVGVVQLTAGLLVWMLFPGFADAERARVEALAPLDAIALSDVPKGRVVLVEGRIAASQPQIFREFVAYTMHQRERDDRQEPDPWVVRATQTPALTIDIGEGTTRVSAQYSMVAATQSWTDPGRYPETRYVGLVRGDPVVVIGTVTAEGIDAETVSRGTKATYIEGIAAGRTVAVWVGRGFAALGTLLVGIALTLWLKWGRAGR